MDQVDAGPRDGGFDAGAMDTGPRDTGMTFDAGRDVGLDVGPPDVGTDAGAPDVGVDAGPRRDLEAAIRSACTKLSICLPYYDAAYCVSDRLAYASGLTPACADASAAYYDCAYSVTCEVYNDSYAWFAHLEVDCGSITDTRDFECF